MTKAGGVSHANEPVPPLRYGEPTNGSSRGRNGAGDGGYGNPNGYEYMEENVLYSYGGDNSSSLSSAQMRNSVSTGNLIDETEVEGSNRKMVQSKSTYFEVGEDMQAPKTGRLSSRREGPFGDVRASIDDHVTFSSEMVTNRRNGANKGNGKTPPKIYKGYI